MQGSMPKAVTDGTTIDGGSREGHGRNYLYFLCEWKS